MALGAHVAVLDRHETTVYAISDQGGMAIFSRNTATGALTQLAGQWGCFDSSHNRGCLYDRHQKGLHYLVLAPTGRFAYAAGEAAMGVFGYRVN